MKKTATAVMMVIAMISGSVMAQRLQGACRADRAALCRDAKNHGGVAKCLKDHEQYLSADCKAMIAEHKEKMQTRHEACTDDRAKFCKDVTPGKGAMWKCLKSHKAELSAACAATFKK